MTAFHLLYRALRGDSELALTPIEAHKFCEELVEPSLPAPASSVVLEPTSASEPSCSAVLELDQSSAWSPDLHQTKPRTASKRAHPDLQLKEHSVSSPNAPNPDTPVCSVPPPTSEASAPDQATSLVAGSTAALLLERASTRALQLMQSHADRINVSLVGHGTCEISFPIIEQKLRAVLESLRSAGVKPPDVVVPTARSSAAYVCANTEAATDAGGSGSGSMSASSVPLYDLLGTSRPVGTRF